jgi:hypothetical protein
MCLRAKLSSFESGSAKYPQLGADVLVVFNNALPQFSPSASIGMMGGNFPPSIKGGLHIHEGKSFSLHSKNYVVKVDLTLHFNYCPPFSNFRL